MQEHFKNKAKVNKRYFKLRREQNQKNKKNFVLTKTMIIRQQV